MTVEFAFYLSLTSFKQQALSWALPFSTLLLNVLVKQSMKLMVNLLSPSFRMRRKHCVVQVRAFFSTYTQLFFPGLCISVLLYGKGY